MSKKSAKQILKTLPNSPGVYKFINSDEKVIYIGKAKDLKKRVSSYFQKSKNHSPWIEKMIEQIETIETAQTNSELESLILETNFIKELRPKYNTLMKDDKNYVYIKVHTEEDFPRIEIVRKRLKDKAKYFGPKTSSYHVKQTLKLLNKIFLFRNCRLDIKSKKDEVDVKRKDGVDVKGKDEVNVKRKDGVDVKGNDRKTPCLDFYIKRCSAPCINEISKETYQKNIVGIIEFLEGKQESSIKDLKKKMMEQARNKEFKKAAKTRDLIENLEKTIAKNLTNEVDFADRDIIAYVIEKDYGFFHLFQIRNGKMIANENFVIKGEDKEKILKNFLQQYYSEATDIPKEILVPEIFEEQELLQEWLSEISKKKVKFLIPQRGIKNHLLELSRKNAELLRKQNMASFEIEKRSARSGKVGLADLKKYLKLKEEPNRIECYDISHLSGTETVGSMVVFEKGKPKKSDYRRFKIRSLKKGEIDDFKSMKEVIERRLIKIKNDQAPNNIILRKPKKSELEEIKKIGKKEKLDIEKLETKEIILAEKDKKLFAFGRIKQYEDKTLEIAALHIPEEEKELHILIPKKLLSKFKGKEVFIITKVPTEELLNFGFREIKLEKNIPKVLLEKAKKMKIKGAKFLKFKIPKTLSFESVPDLIIVDGGKGQLSSALESRDKLDSKVPIISLAKKEEEIFVPGRSESILLPDRSEGLYLVQRIRDEAHRFAISFNQSLREKKAIRSALDEIPGIGPKIKKRLLKTFGSIQGIRDAHIKEVSKIAGEKIAEKIKSEI